MFNIPVVCSKHNLHHSSTKHGIVATHSIILAIYTVLSQCSAVCTADMQPSDELVLSSRQHQSVCLSELSLTVLHFQACPTLQGCHIFNV